MSTAGLRAICVYCGSSDAADAGWLVGAALLGRRIAEAGARLVYGGGGVGLMGACARGAREAGGQVLGVIPQFLIDRELALPGIETEVVQTMHERKIRMFEAAEAFAVLPGAIGTLEEVIELISWRRLGLHDKPVAFWNPEGFWDPLFAQFEAFVSRDLVPAEFAACWRAVEAVDELIEALQQAPRDVRVGFDLQRRV